MALKDSDIDDIHQRTEEEVKKESVKQKQNILNKVPEKAKWPLIAAVAVVAYFVLSGQWKIGKGGIVLGVIALILWLAGKGEVEEAYLTARECLSILQKEIVFRQKMNMLPDGEVYIQERTKERWYGNKPLSRYIGFYIIQTYTRARKYYHAEMNIRKRDRPGDIIEMTERTTIFNPEDRPHMDVLLDRDFQRRKMYELEKKSWEHDKDR